MGAGNRKKNEEMGIKRKWELGFKEGMNMKEKVSKFKKTRVLLATMLALVLSLSFAPAAYADPVDAEGISEAAITKILKVPVGTNVPTITFTFTVTGISINDDVSLASSVPVVGTAGVVSVSFPSATYLAVESVGDSTHYALETPELFGNITWPHTGIFEYRIVENATVFTPGVGETLVESLAVYRVQVHVQEDASGAYFIAGIGAFRLVEDDGEDIGDGGTKVDPTPGGGSNPDWSYSQMTFGNIYTKFNAGDDILTVIKTVAGPYSSTSYYFDYSLTINKPSLVSASVTSYRAYIREGAAIVNNLTPNKVAAGLTGTDGLGNTYINVPIGAPFTFALKHGQSLVFVDAHLGANYTVSESGVSSYVPRAIVTSNNVAFAAVTAAKAASLTVPDGTIITSNPLIGEALNSAAFHNQADGEPITGLTIENLPFIGVIVLAALALGVFIVVKARKRRVEN